jgi:ABC-type nickel/cobalt efflux system permease component RcnA
MRLFLSLFFTFSLGFGCALCTLYTPTTHVHLKFQTHDKKIDSIDIIWEFSSEFSVQTLENYDRNGNLKFDKDELEAVLQVLLDYLQSRKYVSQIGYYKGDKATKNIAITPDENHIYIEDEKLFYMYTIPTNIPIQEELVIRAEFHDAGGFFDFRIQPKEPIEISDGLWIHTNVNNFVGFFQLKSTNKTTYKPSLEDVLETNTTNQTWLGFLESKLQKYSDIIKSKLRQAQKNPSFETLIPLVFFSFIYGLFHAAGPGHGKTLVGSYYLARGGRLIEALWLSIRIGVLHVFGAFLLVLISFYGIQTFVSKLLSDVTLYTTRLSASIILLIGAWMLWRHFFPPNDGHHHHCGCSSCKPKTSWAIAFAAGLVPCPGTVVIFILTFSLGSYLAGSLSAIAMAAGMSVVIFIAAVLGQSLGQSPFALKANKTISLFAIILLLALGGFMLWGVI